jgi:hypothetical protein
VIVVHIIRQFLHRQFRQSLISHLLPSILFPPPWIPYIPSNPQIPNTPITPIYQPINPGVGPLNPETFLPGDSLGSGRVIDSLPKIIADVPEPRSFLAFLFGFFTLEFLRKRKRK